MSLIKLFLFNFFLLLFFTNPSSALSPEMEEFVNLSKEAIKKIGEPQARQIGGALIYTFKDGKAFFLLGKESSTEPRLLNNWCSLIGRREKEDKSLLDAILREAEEETAGLYKILPNIIDESTTYGFFKNFQSKGDKGYLFIHVDNPLSRELLKQAAENQSEKSHKEKSDYLWIQFPSGAIGRTIEVVDMSGQKHSILLRESFLEELNSKEFQAILADIAEKAAKE